MEDYLLEEAGEDLLKLRQGFYLGLYYFDPNLFFHQDVDVIPHQLITRTTYPAS